MSITAPSLNLGWRLLPAVLAAAIAIVGASFGIAALRDEAPGSGNGTGGVVAAEVVAWDLKVFPVGTGGGLTRAQRARFESQRGEVTKIVRRVFDAWVLGLDNGMIKKHFISAAINDAQKVDVTPPKDAFEILARTARIGIEGGVPRTAAADVTVKGDGWKARYTLWMERSEQGWKVVAFDIDRRPQR